MHQKRYCWDSDGDSSVEKSIDLACLEASKLEKKSTVLLPYAELNSIATTHVIDLPCDIDQPKRWHALEQRQGIKGK